MAKPHPNPKLAALRKNLSDLLAEGLVPSNVIEKGGDLLTVMIVTSRLQLDEDAGEEARERDYADALTAVLKEAVVPERIPGRKHRRILKYILPLKKEYLGKSIKARRVAAGEKLTDGDRIVKPSTIRTYHDYEPRALDELARVLVEMEADFHAIASEHSASQAD